MKAPLPQGYAEFITLFNNQKFFEAHEALEAEWHLEKRRNDFYKGLIQLAAALVHVQKLNISGAKSLLETSKKYLAPRFPCYQGIDLKKLSDETELIIKKLESRQEVSRDLQYPIIELVGN